MINNFLSLNLAFIVVVFISTLFLFIGIFYSRKKVSLNTYLVSNRNVGVFNLSATLNSFIPWCLDIIWPAHSCNLGRLWLCYWLCIRDSISNDCSYILWKKIKSVTT